LPAVRRGFTAAHKANRLLLLPLGPDKVHGALLRRTPTHCGQVRRLTGNSTGTDSF